MTKTDNAKRLVLFDPWAGTNLRMESAQRRALDPAERPPQSWGHLRPQEREMLGGLAFYIIAEHGPWSPQRDVYIRERLQEALAATFQPNTGLGGYGHNFEALFEKDEEQRKAWRRLGQAVHDELSLLAELLAGISAHGDLERTLEARRAALDAQLQRLRAGGRAVLDGAGAPPAIDPRASTIERAGADGAAIDAQMERAARGAAR